MHWRHDSISDTRYIYVQHRSDKLSVKKWGRDYFDVYYQVKQLIQKNPIKTDNDFIAKPSQGKSNQCNMQCKLSTSQNPFLIQGLLYHNLSQSITKTMMCFWHAQLQVALDPGAGGHYIPRLRSAKAPPNRLESRAATCHWWHTEQHVTWPSSSMALNRSPQGWRLAV